MPRSFEEVWTFDDKLLSTLYNINTQLKKTMGDLIAQSEYA